jgi:hypothetical protein
MSETIIHDHRVRDKFGVANSLLESCAGKRLEAREGAFVLPHLVMWENANLHQFIVDTWPRVPFASDLPAKA